MSITDGTYICSRCGESRVICGLCSDMEPDLIENVEEFEYKYDKELILQENHFMRRNRVR